MLNVEHAIAGWDVQSSEAVIDYGEFVTHQYTVLEISSGS